MSNFLNNCYKPIIIYIYVLLLPITEVITTYMFRIKMPVTFGMVYKLLFLLYAVIYLIALDKKNKKSNYVYIFIMVLYSVIYMCVTLEMDISIINRENIGYIFTYMYFPMILVFLYRYYKNDNKLNKKILMYSASIYAFTMLVAYITNTQTNIYRGLGQSGWFNSANEISGIFAIVYPIMFFHTFRSKKITNFVLLGLCTWSIVSIGTRVSFLAFVITIVVFLIYSLIKAIIVIKNKESSVLSRRGALILIIISVVLVTSLVIYYPRSSFAKILEYRKETALPGATRVFDGVESVVDSPEKQLEEIIFSGRQIYLNKKIEIYKQSNILEKFFGLTYKSQYSESRGSVVNIERDFHDIFYQYGIVGLIIFLYPMFLIIREFVQKSYKNKRILLESDLIATCLSVLLAIGIAYTGGHILLIPSTSVILGIVFVSLLYDKEIEKI